MKLRPLLLSLTLAACSLPIHSLASNLPKVYPTGEPIEKPMIMTKFVEFSNARKPPELIFDDRQGKPVSMNQHRGKVTLINIWASWCGPCIKELPAMRQLEQDYAHKNLKVVPVSIDELSPDEVYEVLANYQLDDIDSLFDMEHSMNGVMPVNVVPATYVLDSNGNLVGFVRGYLDWEDKDVAPYLDQLIDKYTHLDTATQ
ncbi:MULTISPECIES: TlpA disulfide reductase family protein [Ferrimonas]|uniref:TlpA family protein disulfide reductase n=1 Tax=Ferrimonas TaxID=44011 RepID=UPI00041560AC|nr:MULTISPECIES: TlpA disulfide reductase family protein [Ferrimonas]USD38163.1 redoxin domain-containing protein [Ferrimonas sp. SCSIO 43195]